MSKILVRCNLMTELFQTSGFWSVCWFVAAQRNVVVIQPFTHPNLIRCLVRLSSIWLNTWWSSDGVNLIRRCLLFSPVFVSEQTPSASSFALLACNIFFCHTISIRKLMNEHNFWTKPSVWSMNDCESGMLADAGQQTSCSYSSYSFTHMASK